MAWGAGELVQALRDKVAGKRTICGDYWGNWIIEDAANRIEELEKENKMLKSKKTSAK